MKLVSIFSILFLLGNSAFAQPKTIDKIVAHIGDNIILLSDIQTQKLQAIQAGYEVNPEMDCQILEELMYQNLLINQAMLDSIIITDAQVNGEMENRIRVIENQIGSRQKMEEFYGKTITQIKKEFSKAIRDQLLAKEMERQITSQVSITPREVKMFFEGMPTDSIPLINTQMSFQQIVHYPEITLSDKKNAFKKLETIREKIIGGKSFSTQARINSMDPGSASNGGEISASRGMMVAPFEATVFNLEVNEISEVFETEYGYHIIKLIERKGDNYVCQHILIIAEFAPDALEASALKIDSCYKALKASTINWDEAVLKYSNETTTNRNKGIITNPITGEQTWDMDALNQVDQQIYLLTNSMEKGDISDPSLYMNIFDRKQGVRIVRLMDRTEPHRANLNDDYALIKRAAENTKREKIINEWISDKIKNAYIRLDEEYKSCEFRNSWVN